MTKFFFIGALLFSSFASAYTDGTYSCSVGAPGIPARVIKIETISIKEGIALPYVEITRSFRKNPSDPQSELETSVVKGFATHSQTGDREILTVSALRLDFKEGQIQNCKEEN